MTTKFKIGDIVVRKDGKPFENGSKYATIQAFETKTIQKSSPKIVAAFYLCGCLKGQVREDLLKLEDESMEYEKSEEKKDTSKMKLFYDKIIENSKKNHRQILEGLIRHIKSVIHQASDEGKSFVRVGSFSEEYFEEIRQEFEPYFKVLQHYDKDRVFDGVKITWKISDPVHKKSDRVEKIGHIDFDDSDNMFEE